MYQYQQQSPLHIREMRPQKIRLRTVTDKTKDRNGQPQNECEDRNGQCEDRNGRVRAVTDHKYITTDRQIDITNEGRIHKHVKKC